jgi:hypothetical protein
MTRKPTVCKDCGKLLTEEQLSLQRNRCDICRKEKTRIDSNNRQLAKNLKKYKDRTDMLECKECGWKVEQTGNLYQHIKMHGFTKESYCEKFNCTKDDLFGKIAKIVFSEKVKGDLNPAYQHGGKYSSLSKKFIKYENIDEKEKEEKIKIVIDKISDSIITNGNNSTTLLYWLKQGYSEDEAIEKLSERQTTFSKKICIEKYGEIDGLKRWEERQRIWLNAYNDKTEEEMKIINKKKSPTLENFINKYGEEVGIERFEKWASQFKGVSTVSQDLFWDIIHSLPEDIIELCYFHNLNHEYNMCGKMLDFFIEKYNINIEFNGDYWHANPNKYKEDYVLKLPRGVCMTAKEIWERDEKRKQKLIEYLPSLKIIEVWESDYMNNPKETLERILNEIKLKTK